MDNTTKRPRKDSTAPAAAKPGPVQVIRVDDVSASIWARSVTVKGVPKTLHSATFERSYKTNEFEYKYTRSFDPRSLPRLIEVIQRAEAAMKDLQPS